MTQVSFTQKQLRVTLILAPENSNGVFPGTNSNTLVLSGLRTLANIQTVTGSNTNADVKIFGMRQADMNALTTIFFNSAKQIIFNNMILEGSSDGGKSWTQLFSGMITEAQPEYRGAPAAYFSIQAIVGYQFKILPVPPTTYPGAVAVADIVESLAGKMGYAFENDGVTAQITNPYLPGTYWDQLAAICQNSGTNYVITADTIAIYPQGQARDIPPVLDLNPRSGLIGYPTLEKFGIVIRSLYNPALLAGGKIRVTGSDVPAANGLWSPFTVDQQLEGNQPGGAWMTESQCVPVAA